MLRVLIAEDSPTQRQLLVDILQADPEIQVIGLAIDGRDAVTMTARLRPDVIVMDIQMPGLDGFDATKRIMREVPTPILIVTSQYDARAVAISLQALRAGAVNVLPKPVGPNDSGFEAAGAQFVSAVKAVARVRQSQAFPQPAAIHGNVGDAAEIEIVAFAASTGGPAALQRIFSELPAQFPIPVLVVQHIAAGFVEGFAAWLDATSSLTIKVAVDGEPLQPGCAYIAPDDMHLGTVRNRIQLSSAAPIQGFRPSATYLFESLARAYGPRAAAVVLTGMGQDGLEGLHAMHAAGARIMAQSEESCVIFGMPGAAIAAGLADYVAPLSGLLAYLMRIG